MLLFASFLALVPTLFMISTALKTDEEYAIDKLGLPDMPVLDNFRAVLIDSPFIGWMVNSLILVVGAAVLSTIVSCLAAYAIARMEFKGRDTLLAISTSLMAVPPIVMIVPLFVLYSRIGLISTYQGAILIYAGLITPFSVYLLTTFFRTVPNELFEVGANGWSGRLHHPHAHRAAAVGTGAGDAAGGELTLCLERPFDRDHFPAGGRQAHADGRNQRLPGPLQ